MRYYYGILIALILCFCTKDIDKNKKRVLLIGVDGVFMRGMDQADTSVLKKFMTEGSYSLNARTIIETTSAPGWTSILCGLNSEDTGIFDNSWTPPWLFRKKAKITPISQPIPCLFEELKKLNKKIITKATWDWGWFLNFGNISIPGSIDKEYFCDPYPEREIAPYDACDKEMAQNTIESIKDDFDFMFTYFVSVDQSGHLFGFCSQEYIDRISMVNKNIEEILASLNENGIYENTYVLLTTDHGAAYKEKWHGIQDDDNINVPIYIIGPGIKRNYEIKDYIRTMDVAGTVMKMLGLTSNHLWRSKVINEAFVKENHKAINDIAKFLE
jgi:predicted AlkP superfamily pyrophosphatase or phosphodiesterase